METQSGAKIAIRGKGSVKEGKGKSDAAHASNQDEDLHCLIMADTEEKVNKAKELIHNVIETVSTPFSPYKLAVPSRCLRSYVQAASIPEGQNELKRNQLRELAALNGTLRDDENQACQNCGEIGHRKYDCPHARNHTASIICRVCGNAGHMARDCPERARGTDWRNLPARRGPADALDNDYEKFLSAIGDEDGAHPSRQIGWEEGPSAPGDTNGNGAPRPAPWQRGPTGAAPPWQQRSQPTGNPAPWMNRSNDNYDRGYPGPPPAGGPPPWQSNRGGGGYGGGGHGGVPPWQADGQQYGYNQRHDAPPPPPPPPGDVPPPPPPPPPAGNDPPPPPPPPSS